MMLLATIVLGWIALSIAFCVFWTLTAMSLKAARRRSLQLASDQTGRAMRTGQTSRWAGQVSFN